MSPLPATRPLFLFVFFFCKLHALGLRRNGLLLGGSKILVPPPLCRPFGIGGLPRQLGNAGTKAGARSLLIAGESSRVCSQKVLAFGLCSLVGAIWALGGVERRGTPGARAWVYDTPAGGRQYRVLMLAGRTQQAQTRACF